MSSSGNESSFGGVGADLGVMPPSLHEKFASLGYTLRPPAPGSYRLSSPLQSQGPTPNFRQGIQLTSTPTPTPGTDVTSPISDADILRIAAAVKGMMAEEVTKIVEAHVQTLVLCVQTLADENIKLQRKVDDLEMYSRKNCVRIFGVEEAKTDTDAAVMEIAEQLKVPLAREEVVVSHRVGKRSETKPRPIIARISNYSIRHRLIKESKHLKNVEGMRQVSVNQELTKARAKVAYECRKLVKEGRAKSTFTWDGKIFIIDHNDVKHLVVCLNDLINLSKHLARTTD